MLTEKRHEIILQMLKEKNSISVSEIKEMTGGSDSTVRRDLATLDKAGKLSKVFGGAVAIENPYTITELSVAQKQEVKPAEKRQIARYAAGLIQENDFVYLDAGTTTGYMIEYLSEKNVTFVTNAVDHARRLAIEGFKVLLTGGELKGTTEAVIGSQAVLSLQKYHFTKGFFGTNGISRRFGYTTPDSSESIVKQIAMEHCHQKYILADSSKFGKITAISFAKLEDAQIITERKPSKDYNGCCNIIVAG
jgi:Transcriptional regulators of sugar metabolism